MLIGQCCQELNLVKEAVFFFDKAIKGNPKNPIFYVNKATFLIKNHEEPKALKAFEMAYELGSIQPACVLPYCDYLIKSQQYDKAKEILAIFSKKTGNVVALNMLNKLKPNKSSELDKQGYLSYAYENIQSNNKAVWLAQSCLLISNNTSEVDFINRIYTHWNDIEHAFNSCK
ncbi:tetratricopeptide repeat protein [Pseudoalteromonas espejiana]